ncbi:MAG: toll/interleukin-1 receptor domain-containing protein, partial [Promethearchaeota archaeon]
FISHSMKDSQLINVCLRYLKAYKIITYLAERNYQPGKLLSQKTMQIIGESDYFLVVYTHHGKDSHYVREEIGYWMGKNNSNNLIPFVEKGIDPGDFLCGVEYIEFDPLNPGLGIANTVKYINKPIKMEQKKLACDMGIGIDLLGLASLIFYGIYQLKNE